MRFQATRIEGVMVAEPEVIRDERGGFARSFCEREFAAAGMPFHIAQANLSFNAACHTLRGIHLQAYPHGEPKIVACIKGRVWDVAVDMRPHSPTYRRWEAIELSADELRMFCLSTGIAHGFITLEKDSTVQYFMGSPYVPHAATGVRWDDPAIGIKWPAEPTVISHRDRSYPLLSAEPS